MGVLFTWLTLSIRNTHTDKQASACVLPLQVAHPLRQYGKVEEFSFGNKQQ
jgi:hypothetical protein